ncbi:MAG TPA: glycoside hydrolase family 18 protein [Candidatus Binatia bacterium]|nr:glycoside hydrolase family 18 protein [Candidatus Binatia bacterium]
MSSCSVSRLLLTAAKYILFLLLVGLEAVPSSAQSDSSPQKRLLGYYPSWGIYNTPPYTHDDVPYSRLTHISHAFALVGALSDGTVVIPAGMIDPVLIKRAHAAGVKVLLSIGGGDGIQGPRFNRMARSETARQAFVQNVHSTLVEFGYDGVDIDWEVPNAPDRANCTTLMQELRTELPSPWLISMAVTADPQNYGAGLDIPALAPIVDFFNVMTYDFYGTWSGATGHVSPLYQNPSDPEQAGSTKTSMDLYEQNFRVPAAKMNIGTPFYGYEWDGTDILWSQCATCASYSWNYATYIEQRINQQGWTRNFDDVGVAPYLTNPQISGVGLPGFITYDDESTTARKTTYVMKERGFGGMFTWELSADWDGQRQPLFDAMYNAWK